MCIILFWILLCFKDQEVRPETETMGKLTWRIMVFYVNGKLNKIMCKLVAPEERMHLLKATTKSIKCFYESLVSAGYSTHIPHIHTHTKVITIK